MMKSLKSLAILCLILSYSSISYAQQWGNYTLYSVMNSTAAYLIDTNNAVVNSWTFPTTAKTGYSSYLLPGGTLLRTVSKSGNSFTGGPICGQVQKVDYNGNVIWDYVYSTTNYCSHHDICPMPNGNVLLIAYERKTAAEVSAAGCTQSIEMWPDKIVEIQPTGPTTGNVVWEWHAWDHLVQNVNSAKANYQTSIIDHPELLNINYNTQKDWMHMNGVDYNPMLDQIAFSSHNLNEWYIIDHSTTTAEAASHLGGNSGRGGDILYRWGHPVNYGATGTSILNVTHDSHWIPEGVPNAGDLVGFNNKGVSSSQSSVDRVITPINGYTYNHVAGTAYSPSTYTSRLACSGYSSNMGNSQQLPNGNQLVCVATTGLIYEVNPSGTTIWSKQVSGSVPQAFRYDSCYVYNAAPAIPVISSNANILESTVAATYQWYLNGQPIVGETNQTLIPSQNGMYVVRITDSLGCMFMYSVGFPFTITAVENITDDLLDVKIFPNPSQGFIYINASNLGLQEYEIFIYDAVGKLVVSDKNSTNINISDLQNGVYYITIQPEKTAACKKQIILIK
jgi:hypothetical protein